MVARRQGKRQPASKLGRGLRLTGTFAVAEFRNLSRKLSGPRAVIIRATLAQKHLD